MKTQILTTTFNLNLYPNQIPYFRGAVIEKVLAHKEQFEAAGHATNLFHNHVEIGEGDKQGDYHFRYPLIQYQTHNKRATITGINKGAEALAFFLQHNDGNIVIDGKNRPFGLTGFPQLQIMDLAPTKTHKEYRLYKWLALNQENFETWKTLDSLIEKITLLEKILNNHIIAVLKNLGKAHDDIWELDLKITDFGKSTWVTCHKTHVKAFDIRFAAKINLPPAMGLGKAAAMGFGKQIPHIKKAKNENKSSNLYTIDELLDNKKD